MMQTTTIERAVDLLATRQSEIREVSLDAISVDQRFQRILNVRKAEQIAANYHPAGLGYILVATVANGATDDEHYVIIDGQTRLAALRKLREQFRDGEEVAAIPDVVRAEVFPSLTPAEAAQLFRLRNQQNPVRPWDRDRIGVIAGDEMMLEIVRQAEGVGYTVFPDDLAANDEGDSPTMPYLTEAKRIVAWGKKYGYVDLLASSLNIQALAFGKADKDDDEERLRESVDRHVLLATAELLRKNPNINEEELVRVMADAGLYSLLKQSEQERTRHAYRIVKAVKTVIVRLYNKGKQKRTDQIKI